jgi:uncharacterized membrane protein
VGFVDETIVVVLDVADAYSLWLDYERYPRFMRGIDQVEVTGYCRLRWTGRVCGAELSWDVDVVDRIQDTRLRWRAHDGRETGDVDFQKLDAGSTLVHYQLEYEPELWPVDKLALRACLERRVHDDLKEFKTLAESLL